MKAKRLFAFGPYCLDADERVLLGDGQPVTLPPKDLETLLVLVERAGHIVDKEELLQKVWPGVFVEEGNLSRRIFNLRQVLGDAPDGREYIETIPRRGYRFAAAVRQEEEAAATRFATPQVSEPIPTLARAQPSRTRWLLPLAVVMALTVMAIVVARRFWSPRNPPVQRAMLAVLPFENFSGDPREDYFADGLTEEMIAQLGQLQPAKLGVIARTSIVRYKHTKESMAQIGHELGVGYLLEGSVRRGGDRVRITAQLIQATEQTHLWAESYERPLTDVLNIQREIAEKITHSLSIQLLPAQTGASAPLPVNLESYDKYLLGLHEVGEDTQESVNKAIQYFQEGIAKNPKDARLYSALAEAYTAATTYYSSPAEVMPRAKEAALEAVQLDPNLASGHVRLGYVRLFSDWDWPAAEKEYRRAWKSIRACRKLSWVMPITWELLGALRKRLPAYSRPILSIRLRWKAEKKRSGSTTSRDECPKPLSKRRRPLSWNPRRVFLMPSSRWLTRRWGNLPKPCGPPPTPFASRAVLA